MRRVMILMCDLVCDPRASNRLQEQICSHLEVHPETRLTWLQSSASRAAGSVSEDVHVLTCVAEYETTEPKTTTKRRRR